MSSKSEIKGQRYKELNKPIFPTVRNKKKKKEIKYETDFGPKCKQESYSKIPAKSIKATDTFKSS